MKPGDPRRIVFPFLRRLVPLAAAVAVSACVNSPPLQNDYEFQSLLSEYQWRSAQIQNEQQQKVLASIKRIDVRKSGSDYLVSVDLADAPVAVVIDRILTQTSIGYDLANIRITGRATFVSINCRWCRR